MCYCGMLPRVRGTGPASAAKSMQGARPCDPGLCLIVHVTSHVLSECMTVLICVLGRKVVVVVVRVFITLLD